METQRFLKIIVVPLFLFSAGNLAAAGPMPEQGGGVVLADSIPAPRHPVQQVISLPARDIQLMPLQLPAPVKPSLYEDRLGLICRKEWAFEKKTGLPLRIRLGSLSYVNKLEGKDK